MIIGAKWYEYSRRSSNMKSNIKGLKMDSRILSLLIIYGTPYAPYLSYYYTTQVHLVCEAIHEIAPAHLIYLQNHPGANYM